MPSQKDKAAQFAALHQTGCFVMPNAWDPGSARLVESLGAKAIATTGAGFAFAQAQPDLVPDRDELLANAQAIVETTSLPVSADLQDGFGETPEAVADTIRAAASVGLVGASIEDAVISRDDLFPSIEACAERIRAAVEVAKALPFDFTITARADNFFRGNTDLDDTIARLLAYGDAGADVVYAPAVVKPDAIKAIVGATKKPVNVLAGIGGNKLTVNDYKEIGVRRITIGSALWAVAYQAAKDAATTLLNDGSFEGFDNRMAYVDALKLYS